jgi:hypothetical protein
MTPVGSRRRRLLRRPLLAWLGSAGFRLVKPTTKQEPPAEAGEGREPHPPGVGPPVHDPRERREFQVSFSFTRNLQANPIDSDGFAGLFMALYQATDQQQVNSSNCSPSVNSSTASLARCLTLDIYYPRDSIAASSPTWA